jgi:hypothetical protein
MSAYAVFDSALESITDCGPDLRNGLTNHAPMAIEALCAMERDDAVMSWLERYRESMMPWPEAVEPIDSNNWRAALGDIDRVSDWRAFFVEELGRAPWKEVLNRWVTHFAPAICASAAHGVIRVAHAARALSLAETPTRIAELAAGLGYWAACYQELPTAPATNVTMERPRMAIQHVPVVPLEQRKFTGTIVASLDRLTEFPPFAAVMNSVDLTGDPTDVISELTETFARVYLANAHDILSTIVFVHSVTSGAAVRLLAPHLQESVARDALRYTWQAQCGIYAAFGQRYAPEQTVSALRESREQLIDMAVKNGDEHVIKLTEACLREHELNPKPEYLAAARHAMDMLKGAGS